MKKTMLLSFLLATSFSVFSQNVFTTDFSVFNLAKVDGQGGWSTSTPSLGNGSGGCFSVGCNVKVAAKTMSFPNFTSCTQAVNPLDGVLATGDGPGKSIGTAVNSGALYVALLVNFTEPSSSTSPNANKQVIRFMDNSFGTATRIYLQRFAAGAFKLGVDKNNSVANFSSSTYAYGVDHLIILKYKFNTGSSTDDEAAVFIDPDLSLPEPTPTVSIVGTADATTITRVVFPWNSTSIIPAGFIGVVSVAKDWNQTSLPIANISNVQLNKLQAAKASFKWNVDNGNDIKEFIVQQSINQVNFANVATISYEGNKTYNQEINLVGGTNYIRLVVIDKNGKTTTGNILAVKYGLNIIKNILLSPNPANDKLNITISSLENKKIIIQLVDMVGNIILQNSRAIDIGETTINTNVAALKPGNYIIKIITSNGDIETKKFAKE